MMMGTMMVVARRDPCKVLVNVVVFVDVAAAPVVVVGILQTAICCRKSKHLLKNI
jgi:hypothetical protein